jgi:hypothetical protein
MSDIKKGNKVIINYPTFVKPLKGVVSKVIGTSEGPVYLISTSGQPSSIWDAKYVKLDEISKITKTELRTIIREELVRESDMKRFDVDFYKNNTDKTTSHEEIIRGNKLSEVVAAATKIAKSKGYAYVELHHRDFYIGNLDKRQNYKFQKGKDFNKNPLTESFNDVFVLWANGVAGNLPKAIKKAKYIGKSGKWNNEYKTNAAAGHGTVFFVAASDVKQAKEFIQKATENNSIGKNAYGKFGQTSENTIIKEANVTRIPNFNLESDGYIAMLDVMSKKRTFLNYFKGVVVRTAKDVYSGGKFQVKAVASQLEKMMKPEFLKEVVDKINEKRLRIFVPEEQYNTPKIRAQFAGILALGVLDSLVNDPLDYDLIKSLGDKEVSNLASEFSVNRGRGKMGTMMGNASK